MTKQPALSSLVEAIEDAEQQLHVRVQALADALAELRGEEPTSLPALQRGWSLTLAAEER